MTIIAIDGPSGSGKSTVSRLLAQRLDLPYLDTGAMYRAVALVVMQSGMAFDDARGVCDCAAAMKLEMLDDRADGTVKQQIMVNGEDATAAIRTMEVSQAASAIAVHTDVREMLVNRQREWVAERGGGVVEGRDIGSVVFPGATLKVFLTADHHERVKRRQTDEHAPEFEALSSEKAARELSERDRRDATREASPLVATHDSFIVDTNDKDIEQVVTSVLDELKLRTER